MAHKRPRALCKSNLIPNGDDTLLRPPTLFDSDTDDDDESRSSHSSTKRLRASYKQNGDDVDYGYGYYELRETTPYVVHSQPGPPTSPPLTAQQLEKTTCDLEDWEDLKELFTRAVASYDNDDVHEALPLLRSVINECTRFLHYYLDPSIIFTERRRRASKSPETFTPPEERFRRDWDCEMASGSLSPPSRPPSRSRKNGHRRTDVDLPTAFHTIYGTSLFYIGTIISHSPSLALAHPDEPQSEHSAISYYLAALDVFEAGENLPSKLDAQYGGAVIKEDWRMAIAWGRTLVRVADEKVMGRNLPLNEAPVWPADSGFAVKSACASRCEMEEKSVNDVLVLAMDQFSRGMLHMPRPAHNIIDSLTTPLTTPGTTSPLPAYLSPTPSPPASPPLNPRTSPSPHPHPHPRPNSNSSRDRKRRTPTIPFSRPKELYTIATSVLGVAEKLPRKEKAREREYWAMWADGVLMQVKGAVVQMQSSGVGMGMNGVEGGVDGGVDGSMEEWKRKTCIARGRCWLLIGSARAELVEGILEEARLAEGNGKLETEDAEDAREAFRQAVSFFERATSSQPSASISIHSTTNSEAAVHTFVSPPSPSPTSKRKR